MYIATRKLEKSITEDIEERWAEEMDAGGKYVSGVRLTPESCAHIRDGFKLPGSPPQVLITVVTLQELYAQLMGTSIVKRTARIARAFPNAAIADAYRAASEEGMDVDTNNLVQILITEYDNGMFHALPLCGSEQKDVADVSYSQSVVPILEQPILPYNLKFFNTWCKQNPFFSLYAGLIRVDHTDITDSDNTALGMERRTDIKYDTGDRMLSILVRHSVRLATSETTSDRISSRLGKGYDITYRWDYYPNYLQLGQEDVSLIRKEVQLTLHDADTMWDCYFTQEGRLAVMHKNTGDVSVRRMTLDEFIEEDGGCDYDHTVFFRTKRDELDEELSDNLSVQAYRLLDTYFPGIRNKRVDWNATLRNIIAENSMALAYVGE